MSMSESIPHYIMNSDQWKPDIVVGVDFGMTCTGVAYSMAPDWPEPRPIQRWSGRFGSDLCNKVPTAVAYTHGSDRVVSWGSMVDFEDKHADVCDLFKLNLCEEYLDRDPDAPSAAEALRWFRDYLRCIYYFVQKFLDQTVPRFNQKKVEYIFSTPTTWTSPSMIANIERTIKQAGFEDRPNDHVKMGLTEAEAAAVFVSKNSHQKDDVILVCDVGGGTTDINILKIKDIQSRQTELEQLGYVEGRSIGSALIDFKVKDNIKARLDGIKGHFSRPVKEIAEDMLRGRFETFKCSFGSDASDMPVLLLPVPGLEPRSDFPDAGIFDSKLELRREDLKSIFDENIEAIFALIKDQVKELQQVHPKEHVSFLILSGGMGGSPYVQKVMRARYADRLGECANAAGAMILTASEPQLVVVLGLVSERIQQIVHQTAVYSERCARNSYGVLCRELYDEKKHTGEDVTKDHRDKKKWVECQIDWLIKKGQAVSTENGIEKSYGLKVDMERTEFTWKTRIVMSGLPPGQLPRSSKRPGSWPICTVLASVNPQDMLKKNHRWFNHGQPHRRLDLKFRVLIGAADLQFQIFTTDGKKLSQTHQAIEVRWDPPTVPRPGQNIVKEDSAMIERAGR